MMREIRPLSWLKDCGDQLCLCVLAHVDYFQKLVEFLDLLEATLGTTLGDVGTLQKNENHLSRWLCMLNVNAKKINIFCMETLVIMDPLL